MEQHENRVQQVRNQVTRQCTCTRGLYPVEPGRMTFLFDQPCQEGEGAHADAHADAHPGRGIVIFGNAAVGADEEA